MSWLRIFEAYRNLEAEKLESDARAQFLQDQVTQLQARIETLDERAQEAQSRLLTDREKVADMFAVRTMGEGVYDTQRQPPGPRAPQPQGIAAGPTRVPGYVVAREMTRKAYEDDAARMREEAMAFEQAAKEKLGLQVSDPERGQDAATSAG